MRETLRPDPERVTIDAASRTGEDGEHGRRSDVSTIVRPAGPPGSPPGRGGLRSRTALMIGIGVVVLAVVLVGALTSFEEDPGPPVEIDTSPLPAPKTDEQQVVGTVETYLKIRDDAYDIPDPNYPLLSVYATGAQLQADVDAIVKLRDAGQATQDVPNSIAEDRVKLLSIEGDQARAEACVIGDGIVVEADTREPAYEYPPGFAVTRLYKIELVRSFGAWKVSVVTQVDRWEGVAGCAIGQS